ncbi:MAG: hypothetical protein KDD69_01070 [Bdellovibrionales bacterium]|nr:hypothetical protein [Bdellovibrionales bacterium]
MAKLPFDPFSHPYAFFTCRGPRQNKWHFAANADELRPLAQRTAKQLGYPIRIFRVIKNQEKARPDGFLIVRRILGAYGSGPKEIEWTRVDTEEAARTLRDVSCGPTPYFALSIAETHEPTQGGR